MAKIDTKTDFELVQQQQALMSYLEALLLEVQPEAETELECEPEQSVANADEPVVLDRATDTTLSENSTVLPIPTITEITDDHDQATLPITAGKAVAPAWATPPFQVLSFEVGGIVYAASLEQLHGILPLPALTRVPTSIPWFLGLFRNRGVNVKVIDLTGILDSAHQPTEKAADNIEQEQFVLLLDQGRWGFVTQRVKNIVTLREDSVQWCHDRTMHGVLSGTVVDQMCVLLDLDRLLDGLNKGIWAPERPHA